MNLNLDKIISSQAIYNKSIGNVIETLKKQRDQQSAIKKVAIFCKYTLSVNHSYCKKYLVLMLIKDLSDNYQNSQLEKILDENIPVKLLKIIVQQNSNKQKQSFTQNEEQDYIQRLVEFGIETINFWSKKMSFSTVKSQFGEALEQLKKLKIEIPKIFQYYESSHIVLGLWGDREENTQQLLKNQDRSPLISQLFQKFQECKILIEQKINTSVLEEQDILLKPIINQLRAFLLTFFSKYKHLQVDKSVDKDIVVVYFHIINNLFKKVSNKFYLSVNEMIGLTKQVFEGTHSSDFSSVDRMDIVNLAGIQKYNAISIFQRIHARIQAEEMKIGPCQLSFSRLEEEDRRASGKKFKEFESNQRSYKKSTF